jgi:hypothetical protein
VTPHIRMTARAVVGLYLISVLLAGCAATGGSLPIGADDAQRAEVDLGPLPADAPPAAITSGAAVAIASTHTSGGPDRGVFLGFARGRASESAGSPVKTVWVVAYGPGGQVPMMGPQGGSETISMQIVLIDDQTGTFMRAYLRSAP